MNDDFFEYLIATNQVDNFLGKKEEIDAEPDLLFEEFNNYINPLDMETKDVKL